MWSNSLDKAPLNNACQRGGSWPPGGAQNFTPWCLHVSQCVPQLVNSHTFGCLCRAMGSWGVGLVWDCSHTLHTPMPLGACVAVGQSCQKCGTCVSGVGWLTLLQNKSHSGTKPLSLLATWEARPLRSFLALHH